VVCC